MPEIDPELAARSKRLAAEWQTQLNAAMERVAAEGGDPREVLDAMLTVAIANKASLEGATVVAAHLKEIAKFYESPAASSSGRAN